MGVFGRFYHILTDNHIHVNCIYIFKKTKNGLFFLITHIDFFIIFSIIVQLIFFGHFQIIFECKPPLCPNRVYDFIIEREDYLFFIKCFPIN